MLSVRKTVAIAAFMLAMALPASATHVVRRGPTSHLFVKKKLKPGFKPSVGIAPERATQIQTALIRSGYLSGEPSGHWDAGTQAAMEKLQGDNGWQTKLVPDSRAIIKLGLGSSTASGNSVADQATLSTSNQPNAFSR